VMKHLGAACVVAALFFSACLLLVDADGQFKIPSETCSHLSLLKSEAWTACLRALESVADLELPARDVSLATWPVGKDVLALEGQLGEGARVETGRRRGGSLTFYESATGGGPSNFVAGSQQCSCGGASWYSRRRQWASNCGAFDSSANSCYNRGFTGGSYIQFWDKSGFGQNFKIELWWRITGNDICLKYMAWEGGQYFYNLLEHGTLSGGASEKCIKKSENTTYSQGDLIADFVDQCDLLESKFQSRCKDQWRSCMLEGSGGRRRFKGSEERRSERRLLATDTTSDTTQSGWWSQPSWEVDCVS